MQSKRKPFVDRATEEAHGESYAECIGSDETVCIRKDFLVNRSAAGRVDLSDGEAPPMVCYGPALQSA